MIRKALVVAIDDYQGVQNDLTSCLNDARQFRSLLQSTYGFTVRTLTDGDATIARVEDELDWLFRGAKANDRLVFYYSGHGHTKLVDGVMQEYLVLHDGLFQDNSLSSRTQDLPDGILTVIFDSCFSGGMHKLILSPDDEEPVEIARVKQWTPGPENTEGGTKSAGAGAYKRFGMSTVTTSGGAAKLFSAPEAPFMPKTKAAVGEQSEPEIKGLLIAACREDETASASTSRTEGLSAFTWGFLKALRSAGPNVTAEQAFRAAATLLAVSKFRQTPVILEPARPGNLRFRTFLQMSKLEALGKSANGLEGASEVPPDKFWNVVLPILTRVGPSVLREITRRRHKGADGVEVELDTETKDKFLGAIASILPHVISAVPPIVNAIRRRRKKDFDFGHDNGGVDFSMLEPLLPEIIGSVAPAVLAVITNPARKSVSETNGFGAPDDGVISALANMIPGIVGAVVPMVVDEFDDTDEQAEHTPAPELEVQKGIFSSIQRLVTATVRHVGPIVISALARQKSAPEEQPEERQKFLSLLVSAVPAIISAVGPLLRRSRPRKKSASPVAEDYGQNSVASVASAINSVVPAIVEAIMEAVENIEEEPQTPEPAAGAQWPSSLVA